ncbi:hypothetical protein KHA80_10845 [Anaerobacillus sp. HL2]|nr:hypothetical protein KHA80_10845 [Anaerobacillus sp. HL2]
MDIKLKKDRSSDQAKIVFMIAIICLTGVMKVVVEVEIENGAELSNAVEDHYFQSWSYIQESENLEL